MRNAVREYIDLSTEEKSELWKNATFVFDTNVFLNLYRYTKKTRDLMFKAFSSYKNRIWMPNHVAHEIMKNRCEIIHETNARYDVVTHEMETFLQKCCQELRLTTKDEEYIELQKYILDWIKKNEKKNNLVVNFFDDAILEQLLTVFEGKVGSAFSEEDLLKIKKDGEDRFSKGIPPGYKDSKKKNDDVDNNAYGDLIVWKEILNYSKSEAKDIIFVTNDKKEDWWYSVGGKTVGPRVELKKEFENFTGHKFHMYTMFSFISLFDEESEIKVEKETINEIEIFSRVIRRIGSRQELAAYYDALDNEDEKAIAKTKFRIMKLREKNRKRENSILGLKMNHSDWAQHEVYLEQIRATEAHIQRDNETIAKLEEKINMLQRGSMVLL